MWVGSKTLPVTLFGFAEFEGSKTSLQIVINVPDHSDFVRQKRVLLVFCQRAKLLQEEGERSQNTYQSTTLKKDSGFD
jgi:hypothetical protein